MDCSPNETYFITPQKPEATIRYKGQLVKIYMITGCISNLKDWHPSPPRWELGRKLEGIPLGESIDKRIIEEFKSISRVE